MQVVKYSFGISVLGVEIKENPEKSRIQRIFTCMTWRTYLKFTLTQGIIVDSNVFVNLYHDVYKVNRHSCMGNIL